MQSEELPIHIEFEQTIEHIKDLMNVHRKNNKWVKVTLVVTAIFLGLHIINSLQQEDAIISLLSTLIPIASIGIICFGIIRFIRKRSLKESKLYGHRELIFDAKTVLLKTQFAEVKYTWDAILKMKESSLSYLLYITKNQAVIVAKTAFRNEN